MTTLIGTSPLQVLKPDYLGFAKVSFPSLVWHLAINAIALGFTLLV
ncbi:hypothetical protein H6F77_19365 [Microcoleus sp. FACHB-831]|nr:hypothetical protein [Microcoleus sp. FACHB-831]MBD1923214.1 hypothetical protein [Microcoleus sp. FACHB-831]